MTVRKRELQVCKEQLDRSNLLFPYIIIIIIVVVVVVTLHAQPQKSGYATAPHSGNTAYRLFVSQADV